MLGLAIRAALLDGSIFQEVRDRQETTFSALGVVAAASVALGLGIWSGIREPGRVGFNIEENLVLLVVVSTVLSGWFLWTAFVWVLGIRLFQGPAGFRAALRSLGLCYAPMLFSILAKPAPILVVVGVVWILLAGVVAVKHTLDLPWWKAAIAATVGWAWALVGFPVFMLLPYVAAPA